MTHYSFGAWVRHRRKALDLTQIELARRAGCTTIMLQKLEADERRPSPTLAAQLADHLQLGGAARATFLDAARHMRSADHLPAPAAPLNAPGRAIIPGNLPAPLTTLVGRIPEQKLVGELLRRPDVRLVTLTGPGGTGKTRLALHVAACTDGFPDGCWFVDLAPLFMPTQVADAITQTLGLVVEPSQSSVVALTTFLRSRRLLLLLDNFEHLLSAAPLVTQLLRVAPDVRVLVTSRCVLHLSGEHEIVVAPLPAPPPDVAGHVAQIAGYDAVRLFVARAQAARADFRLNPANAEAVAMICRQLDGLPLAIELVAAHVRQRSPESLLALLMRDGVLPLLANGPRDLPARQRTIQATIVWSYALLQPYEQASFARLSVFAGRFDASIAAGVCADPEGAPSLAPNAIASILDGLAAQHLVVAAPTDDGETSYSLLETVRAFAAERLDAEGKTEDTFARYCAGYLAFAEAAEQGLRSAEQLTWLTRLDAADENLRNVLARCLQRPDEQDHAVSGLRLASMLWYYWLIRGRPDEAERILRTTWLESEAIPALVRARAGARLGMLLDSYSAKSPLAAALCQQALVLARAIGDRWTVAFLCDGVAAPSDDQIARWCAEAHALGDPWLAAWMFWRSYGKLQRGGDTEVLLREYALPAAERAGDRLLIARVAHTLGRQHYLAWHYDLADRYMDQAFTLRRMLGDRRGMSAASYQLGKNALDQRQFERAVVIQRERVWLERNMGNDAGLVDALAGLSDALRAGGDRVGADAALEEALMVWERLRVREVYTDGVYHLIYNVLLVIGDLERAQLLVDAIMPHTTELPQRAQAQIQSIRGLLACARGHLAVAEEALSLSIGYAEASGMGITVEFAQILLAWTLSFRGACAEAHTFLDQARATATANRHQCFVAFADGVRGQVWLAQGELKAARAELLPALRTWAERGLVFDSLAIAEDVGRLFIDCGKYLQGVRLLAAAATRRALLGLVLWPMMRPVLEAAAATARMELGDGRFQEAWMAGSMCIWEQAIAEAFQDEDIT